MLCVEPRSSWPPTRPRSPVSLLPGCRGSPQPDRHPRIARATSRSSGMHAPALRFPTPPTSPHASTRRRDDTKGRSINTERRRSLLVASQLNAALAAQQQQQLDLTAPHAAQTTRDPHDDLESAKSSDALADPEAKGGAAGGDSKPALAATSSHVLEPQHPLELKSHPLRGAIPKVRRNSWIGGGEDHTAAAAAGSNAVQSLSTSGPSSPASPGTVVNAAVSSTTFVEPLQPSALRWHTPPTSPQHTSQSHATSHAHASSRSGAHPVFASEQAAAKYSRMLRRASWPMQMPQMDELTVRSGDGQPSDDHAAASSSSLHDEQAAGPPSYRPTPISTPAATPKASLSAAQAHQLSSRFAAPTLAELAASSSSGDEDESAQTYEMSMESVPVFAANSAAAPASSLALPAKPPSPLVNLLLLGDESCGLGVALDEFAGRDRNIGLTFKTRKVYLPKPKLHGHGQAHSGRSAHHDEEHKQLQARSAQQVEEQKYPPPAEDGADSTEEYRVRCWHTPGLRAESIGRGVGRTSFAPYLRSTHAIALVYDVSSEASLAACARWAECLIAHNDALVTAAREGGGTATAVNPRPILLVGNNASWTKSRRAAREGKRGSLSMLPGARQDAAATSSASAAASRSARRSSLPHAHTALDGRGSDGSAADRAVSPSQVASLLNRLVSAYSAAGFGAVSSVVINANGWKDRYRVFHQIAAMVREAGTCTSTHSNANSRSHSPTQRVAADASHVHETAAGE